ncbi:GM25456 [Drosophila sechellia]|uniref:GM25456 n=1 Tax=Drosophila sechellia TaxID=7238 RepID=B4HHC7_DROSE|nr:GM25456 [Drosophila sechellia]
MTSQQLAGTIVIGTTGQLPGIKRPLERPRSRSRSGKEEERYTYRGTYRGEGAGGGAGEGEIKSTREPSKDSSRKDKTHGCDEADSPREQRNQQLHHRDHLDGDPDPNTAEDLDDHLAAADCRRMMNCTRRHKTEGQRIHMQIMEYPRMLMSIDCSQLQGKSDREEPEDLNQTP